MIELEVGPEANGMPDDIIQMTDRSTDFTGPSVTVTNPRGLFQNTSSAHSMSFHSPRFTKSSKISK